MVTAAGAEALPFLASFCVLPASLLFFFAYGATAPQRTLYADPHYASGFAGNPCHTSFTSYISTQDCSTDNAVCTQAAGHDCISDRTVAADWLRA